VELCAVIWELLFAFFVLVTIIQIVVWLVFPLPLLRWVHQDAPASASDDSNTPVSIIICARNEAPNLRQFLPSILAQRYDPDWEVVVVDDDSTDDTRSVIETFQRTNNNLRYVHVPHKTNAGKKHALAQGIEAARYEWLALTDADCQPASADWLRTMMAERRADTQIVLGYAPLDAAQTWLGAWTRYETIYVALQYAAMAHFGWPYMGVGRNLLIMKQLYRKVGGFEQHLHLASGDDDLLVNATANGKNTVICFRPVAYVHSAAKSNWAAWIRQKNRHLSAGLAYSFWLRLAVGGVAFTHAVHYGLAAILLLAGVWPVWVVLGVLLRWLIVMPIVLVALKWLRAQDLSSRAIVLDIVMALWAGAIAPYLLVFGKRNRW
jgi:poly-beta-1,6-N-acetyl-D-glucosamine synthase